MPMIDDAKLDQWIAQSEKILAEVSYLKRREAMLVETIKLAIVAMRGDARTFYAAGHPAIARSVNGRADKLQTILDEATGPGRAVTPADAVA